MRLGVLFDIDALGGGSYGYAAYRLLFEVLGSRQLAGCWLSDGDTAACLAGRSNEYCIAVESTDARRLQQIRLRLATCGRPGLLPPALRFLNDAEVGREPLVLSVGIDDAGRLLDCKMPWLHKALKAADEAGGESPQSARPEATALAAPHAAAGAGASATVTLDPLATLSRSAAAAVPASSRSRIERAAGAMLGQRYRVLSVHRGGMGLVYVVEDLIALRKGVSLRLALKTFQERFLWDEAVQRRFEREALQWVDLGSHPHIVHALLVERIEAKPYIWLEFVDGGSLADRMESGPIGTDEVLDFALQFVRGMRHAYEQHGVIHRDIKPANTLLTKDGIVKISDFGLSKLRADLLEAALAAEEADSSLLSPELRAPPASGAGACVGTPAYMPPEAILDPASVDTRGDIYSFGVMLHEMLTGRGLFRGHNALEQHLHARPVPPSAVNRAVPSALDEIVLQCVEKAPERRFAAFADLEAALLRCGAQLDGFQPRTMPAPAAIPAKGVPFMKGITLMEFGRLEAAIAAFQEVLAIDSEEAEAPNNIAVCLAELGRLEEAVAWGTRAVALRPEYAVAWANLGGFQGRLGRFEEGLRSCERAVALQPTWAEGHANLGANLTGQGRYAEALACFERALLVDPVYWKAHVMAAEALGYAGAWAGDILQRAEKALAFEPRHATAHAIAAACWADLGDQGKADRHLQIALELEPANALAGRVSEAFARRRTR